MSRTADLAASPGERSRRLRAGILTGVVTRGVGLVAPLLVIPLVVAQLGDTLSGVWLTLTALTSMLLWADLGLGNGLMTRLSGSLARRDLATSRQIIAVSYAVLTTSSLAACALLVMTVHLVPWQAMLNAEDPRVGWMVVAQLGAFLLNVPLGLVQRVQYALQEVGLSNLLMLVAPGVTVLGAVWARGADLPPIATIACISFGQPVASIVATLVTVVRHPELIPAFSDARWSAGKGLLVLGTGFLAVQGLSAVALNVDNLLIAHTAGVERVTDYAVVARVFAVLGLAITVVNQPLWPANAEALARGDTGWVRRTTRRLTLLSASLMGGAGLLIVLLGPWALRAWMGPSLHVTGGLLIGFALLWTLVALAAPSFMVLNAQGRVWRQALAWLAFLVLTGLGKFALGSAGQVDWFPWVTAVAYAGMLMPVALSGVLTLGENDGSHS